ncbi:MAG: glycosyltransferase [Candidatus Saccharibacteria bacterium]|nr:glycosyltransferase [Candidatus Saccharibacteria bacterium]
MKQASADKPLVSLLVAIYNVERYLTTCLESLIHQTYDNIEIILVNDGSTDASGDIADAYAKKDPRIRVIHQSNSRLSATRNKGLEAARGEYVVFIDSDDFLAKDYVAYMLSLFQATDADFVGSANVFTTRYPHQVAHDEIYSMSGEEATAEFLYPRMLLGAWNKMYKRSFIEDNKLRFYPELFTGEGMRFITDAAQRAKKVGIGSRKVYYYRLNNQGSATTKPDVRQGTGSIDALDSIRDNLILKSEIIDKALDWHYWLDYFYILRIIVITRSQQVHAALYRKALRYIRRHTWSVINAKVSLRFKVRMIAIWAFPVTMARLANWMKLRRIAKDTMHD